MSRYKILSFTSFLIIIIIWCIITYCGIVKEMFVPSPTAVIKQVIASTADGSLWANCWVSTKRVMIGWALAAVVALPCGMVMARSKGFNAVIQPIMEFARYLPVVALVPLTILYIGIDEGQKYLIIFLGTFFQLVLMIQDTVAGIDKNQINAARTLGANKWQVYKEVIFKAALPGVLDDFRMTIGWAWTYLVVAEMVAASSGLGYIILKSQRFMGTDVIFMGLIFIGLIGLVTDFIMRLITRLVVPWHKRLDAR